MTRNLETLVEQFNRANEIDRISRIATGETHWAELDGVQTTMVRAWLDELTLEEKEIFYTYISSMINRVARHLGFENAQEQFKDAGQKIFAGLKMGINTS